MIDSKEKKNRVLIMGISVFSLDCVTLQTKARHISALSSRGAAFLADVLHERSLEWDDSSQTSMGGCQANA